MLLVVSMGEIESGHIHSGQYHVTKKVSVAGVRSHGAYNFRFFHNPFTSLFFMDMLVGKEMILTVLVISVALGAVTELQIVPVQLGPSAHSTFVHRLSAVSGLCGVHLAFEILFSPR